MPTNHTLINELTHEVLAFRNERDWKQFHNPKDLAISLILEAGEVLEHFQWKDSEEIKRHIREKKSEIGDELADVLHHLLLMSHDMDIDLIEAFHKKMEQNRKKYPVEKVRGKNKKYTEY
jgi:dCTP diphosphatase